MSKQLELNRLRWRSRRGMLELDLLLLPFFDQHFPKLSASDQSVYARLLEQDDPDLQLWFSRQATSSDPALQKMVERILARAAS